jgi:predicted phage tail protein
LGIYYWRVEVYMGEVWVAMPVWKLTITATPPMPPVLVSPVTGIITNTLPLLTWNAAPGADRYEVQVDNDPYFKTPDAGGVTETDALTFAVTTLPKDGKYYWRVRSVNNLGVPGSWTLSRSFTFDTTPPAAPNLYLPTDNKTVTGMPTFQWYAVSGAYRYQFQYAKDTAFTDTVYTSAELGSSTVSHKPATGDLGVLYWRVRVRDAAGNWSAWSAYRTVTINP